MHSEIQVFYEKNLNFNPYLRRLKIRPDVVENVFIGQRFSGHSFRVQMLSAFPSQVHTAQNVTAEIAGFAIGYGSDPAIQGCYWNKFNRFAKTVENGNVPRR